MTMTTSALTPDVRDVPATRLASIELLIDRAIEGKVRLYLDYAPGLRLVEPHAYGRSKLDNQLLYAYQVGGASESGGIPDWRTFRVDRIRSAEYDSETFEVRPDFDREKLKMRRVVIWAKRR